MTSKTRAYIKSYDEGETKWMYFLIDDNELLEKENYIWNKVSNSAKKEFDCKPIYNKKSLKSNYYNESTNFHDI